MAKRRLSLALLLILLGGLVLFPLWRVAFLPLLDYPNHLARAFVLTHLRDPAFRFQQLYAADWGLYPYLTADLSLLGLERIFPIELAGRIFLSLCVLAVPLSAWFFLRQANPGADPQACWLPLLAHHAFFLYGFLSFYLGLAFCFFALGLWLRCLAAPRAARWVAAGIAFLALYFTHLLCFTLAGAVCAAYCVAGRVKPRAILHSALLFLPGALLFLRWRSLGGGGVSDITFLSLREKFANLPVAPEGYSGWLNLITLIALAVFFLAAAWRNAEFRWEFRWLGITGILFVAYWLLPWTYGDGAFLDIRVLPVVFVTALASVRFGRRGWKLAPLAVFIIVARAASVTQHFAAWQPELAGLARSFDAIPHNARVLPVVETEEEDPARRPFAHFWAYGVIRRGWLSPYLFHNEGLVPLRIRDAAYAPEGFWDLHYEETPTWDLVQRDYDYVWAYNVPRFSAALEAIGERTYVSGSLVVFRLSKTSRAPSSTPASFAWPQRRKSTPPGSYFVAVPGQLAPLHRDLYSERLVGGRRRPRP